MNHQEKLAKKRLEAEAKLIARQKQYDIMDETNHNNHIKINTVTPTNKKLLNQRGLGSTTSVQLITPERLKAMKPESVKKLLVNKNIVFDFEEDDDTKEEDTEENKSKFEFGPLIASFIGLIVVFLVGKTVFTKVQDTLGDSFATVNSTVANTTGITVGGFVFQILSMSIVIGVLYAVFKLFLNNYDT